MNQSLHSTKADKLKRGKSLKRLEEKFLVFLKIKRRFKNEASKSKKGKKKLKEKQWKQQTQLKDQK